MRKLTKKKGGKSRVTLQSCGEMIEQPELLFAQHEKVGMLAYVVGVGDRVWRERKKRKCGIVFSSSLHSERRKRRSMR